MKIIRIITIVIIIVGGIMLSKDMKGSQIVLFLGIVMGLLLGVKNYTDKNKKK